MSKFQTDIGFFREWVCRHVLRVDFKPRSEKFFGSVNPILDRPGVTRVVRWTHSPGAFSRDAELAKDNDETVALILVQRGAPVIRHCGQELTLAPGGMTLLRNWEPGEMGSDASVSCIGIMMRRDALLDGKDLPDQLVAKRWGRSEASQLLKAYVSCLAKSSRLTDSDLILAAANHISELTGAAARAQIAAPSQEGDKLWRTRLCLARATLSQRFRDPSLRESDVAAEQNISCRYLQKIFERGGISFIEELNKIRIETVYNELLDKKFVDYSIISLAMNAGFNDVSHFNKLFVRRFGIPPSQVRKIAAE